jgi:hypothetical protein
VRLWDKKETCVVTKHNLGYVWHAAGVFAVDLISGREFTEKSAKKAAESAYRKYQYGGVPVYLIKRKN